MPKIPTPLTDREIRALKPKDKIYKKCDGRGLYIFLWVRTVVNILLSNTKARPITESKG